MSNNKILLTGVTGFLGSHTALQLLDKGYEVIGTLRDLSRAEEMKTILAQHTPNIDKLSFAQADLLDEDVWGDLTKGVHAVQHIASPFPSTLPKNEADLILPAKNGTLNILRAAEANGVKKVVLTSSTGSIAYGRSKDQRSGTFDETNWTDVDNRKDTTPYFRSKTIAERAAWDFVAAEDVKLELTTICPGAILGPVLEKDFGTSANLVIKAMDGSSPAIPPIGFELVDVRSVSALNVLAMESPKAAGERFVATTGYLSFKEVTDILREAYPERKIPKALLPAFAVRLFAYIEKSLQPVLIDLGTERRVDHRKAKEVLDWKPIDPKTAIIACAESVIKLGLL